MKQLKKELIVFFTFDYPVRGKNIQLASLLEKSGVDAIEIGIPCSDPIADGPIIEQCSNVALTNGFRINAMFKELLMLRNKVQIPVYLMGYYNQVYVYGEKKFIKQCKKTKITGIIIPDLPEHSILETECRSNKIFNVKMICPTSNPKRIKKLDKKSSGFIYAISSNQTTGGTKNSGKLYLRKIQKMNLRNKIYTGFGIRDNKSFKNATKFTNGAIVGSAFLQFIMNPKNRSKVKIKSFIKKIQS